MRIRTRILLNSLASGLVPTLLVGFFAKSALDANVTWTAIAGLGVASTAFSICIGLYTARKIAKPLSQTVAAIRNIAIGDGDLTQRLPMRKYNCSSLRKCGREACPEFGKTTSCWDTVGSNAPGQIHCPAILSGKFESCHSCPVMQSAIRDETDEVKAWFNTFVAKLSQVIHDITASSSGVSVSSTDLASTATQLAVGSQQMSGQSHTVSAAAEQLTSNMGSMATSSKQMLSSVQTLATSAEEMTTSIGEIARNAEHASTVAAGANELAEASNQCVEQLGTAANGIGKVVETIQEIAEQTNLLALNATIEAARAGEAGKGFAVVATEVKELAKQTADATEDIRKRIEGIQTSSSNAIDSIGRISGVIQEVNNTSVSIASAVEEQSITSGEIARSISDTSEAAQTVAVRVSESAIASKEITQSIAGIELSIQDAAAAAETTQVSSDSLLETSGQLQALLDTFVTDNKIFDSGPVQTAHRQWAVRLANLLSGKATLTSAEISRETECAFGKWYYGEGEKEFGHLTTFRAIESEHCRVHQMAKEIADLYNGGDQLAAVARLADFRTLTHKLCSLLEQLEGEANGQLAVLELSTGK